MAAPHEERRYIHSPPPLPPIPPSCDASSNNHPEFSVLLLGLDNAGKTTFLSQLKSLYTPSHPEPASSTIPTVGQNVALLDFPDVYLKIWDIGGQTSLRGLWNSYYKSAHAIIFLIDSTDIGSLDGLDEEDGGDLGGKGRGKDKAHEGRLEECRKVLEDVLGHSDTAGVPVLVLANKQDREDSVEVVRIKDGFVRQVFEGRGGGEIRDSRVLPCSALKGSGVKEAVEWVRKRVLWCKDQRPGIYR